MLRPALALQISTVSLLPLMAVAQEVGCRPYRVVYVGDLSSYPLADAPLDEGATACSRAVTCDSTSLRIG